MSIQRMGIQMCGIIAAQYQIEKTIHKQLLYKNIQYNRILIYKITSFVSI